MKIFNTSFKKEINIDKYFNDQDICFIDIETTGLSRKYHSIYLIGLLYFNRKENYWTLIQLFADNIDEEKLVLEEFIQIIDKYDLYVTYNGDTFDIPFINNRLKKFHIDYELKIDRSFDIYRFLRKNKNIFSLENMKLKTVEESLGIYRDDIYSGKECIQFYKSYMNNKDEELRDRVLKHNYDDLFYLIDLLNIIDVINEKRSISLNDGSKETTLYIENIADKGDLFSIDGTVSSDTLNFEMAYYHQHYSLSVDGNNYFKLTIECSKGMVSETELGLYIDKNNIVLPDNILDSTIFPIPKNLILLKVEKNYIIENIHPVLSNIFSKCLVDNPI